MAKRGEGQRGRKCKWPMCQPEAEMGDVLLPFPLWGEVGFPCASHHGIVSLPMLEGKLAFGPHLFMYLTKMYLALTVCCFKYTSKHFTNIN